MNRLWTEGLLDAETFSQTDEQKKAKGKNNQIGLFADYNAYFTLGGTEPSTADPMAIPVKSDMVDSAVYGKHPGLSTGAFAISSANPNPEATMRWIDYLYSYDGATLFNHGPEGMLFEYVDKENHVKKFLDVPGGDREEYRATLTPNYGISTPGFEDISLYNGLRGEFDEWIVNENKTKLEPIAQVPFPIVYLTEEEQAEVSRLRSDLDTYVVQMEAKFVTGIEPLANWDSYIAQVKKMGGDRIVEIYQAAYDRWAEN